MAFKFWRLTGTLGVAEPNRLSRSVVFQILADGGIDLAGADLREATTMTNGVLADVTQHEREALSAHTKAACASARDHGKSCIHDRWRFTCQNSHRQNLTHFHLWPLFQRVSIY